MRWVTCLVIFCCVTPALAQIDNSAIECADNGPTFFPRGDHWAMTPPAASNPIQIRHQKDGSSQALAIPISDLIKTINIAHTKWQTASCSPGTPNLKVEDGITSYSVNYPTRDRGDTYDGNKNLISSQNIIYFIQQAVVGGPDRFTVALTTNTMYPDTGFTITSDMEFNDYSFDWRAQYTESGTLHGPFGCSASSVTCYDIGSVALHEFGHFFGLNHVQCTDAVMYPQAASTAQFAGLTIHETAGICTLYPPRNAAVADRDRVEQCAQTSQCPNGQVCIKSGILSNPTTSADGWCTTPCSNTSQCPDGFVCGTISGQNTPSFCKPGVHNTGGATTGGGGGTGTTDNNGQSLDICSPCSAGTQCANGECISDNTGLQICTIACLPGGVGGGTTNDSGCPNNMECLGTSDPSVNFCWPINGDATSCAQSTGVGRALNELCFSNQGTTATDDDFFTPCGPDLVCVDFKPSCQSQVGACVLYCNQSLPCAAPNQQCCFGIDDNGGCVPPNAQSPHGGCYTIRHEGESCVTAEQSVCEQGSGCFFFGDATTAKCYSFCGAGDACDSSQQCHSYGDSCSNVYNLCCDKDTVSNTQCEPLKTVATYDVGVRCSKSSECNTNMCIQYNGENACSRICNAVTGYGCPGNVDVNGDGTADGGFTCRLIGDEGRCWPNAGPVAPLGHDNQCVAAPGGGCCSDNKCETTANLFYNGAWLPLAFATMRYRRRRIS